MSLDYSNARLRTVYARLPVPLQNAVTSAYGFRKKRSIYGRTYAEVLDFLRRSERMDEGEVLTLRDEACASFLQRARADSSYWRRVFDRLNLRSTDLTADALAFLPVLSKEEVRLHIDEIVSAPWAKGEIAGIPVHTSGTTGKGLHLLVSTECGQREYAFRDLHRSWGGVSPGDRTATLAGHPVVPIDQDRPPYWRYNAAFHQTLFSSQHMTRASLLYYLDELRRLAPRLIHGYPSSLYVIASFCLESGEERIRPKSVFSHSETLFEWQRAVIEKAFGCKVFNWYGNTEMTANIVECEYGRMHVKNEYSLVEFLRADGTQASPGEYARIVGTAFGNDATPLIRYDTGDMAILSNEHCECGRPGPIVDQVLGRQEDIFVTPDGRMVGRLDHVFKDALDVVEAQLVQDHPDLVVARVVRREGYSSDDEAKIAAEIRLRLGDSVRLSFDYVDRIPREANGKFRFAVSRVPLPISLRPPVDSERELEEEGSRS